MKNASTILLLLITIPILFAQTEIPAVYTRIHSTDQGQLYFAFNDSSKYLEYLYDVNYSIEDFTGNIEGTTQGLQFSFGKSASKGKMYFGLIHYNDSKHPMPVFFRNTLNIDSGRVHLNISDQLAGRFDMVGWEKSGRGVIGYRVQNEAGRMLYEGRVAFKGTGPFEVANTIIEGPFVDQCTYNSSIISLNTLKPEVVKVQVNGKYYSSNTASKHHEIKINELKPDTTYRYTIILDSITQTFTFRTAPLPGSQNKFTFAYASDSRSGKGGGERDFNGTNYYIMRKIMALAYANDAAFLQFTGDFINGYRTNTTETNLQYANWKRAIEPWAHHMPVYEGMGNHEAVIHLFPTESNQGSAEIDRFPFETHSSEVIFNTNFVNPENGPISEDGAVYDPDKNKTDFPPYKENVYSYTYDNIGVICLNSDYLYAPNKRLIRLTGGNLHGYILDNQLQWLKETLEGFEKDKNIDHVFVTQHTPAFPNGGHVGDDMWYSGNNQWRPWLAGKPLGKGILERRDEYLDLLINKSSKVVAILTGDEHNYCRTTISDEMPRYPEPYYIEKVALSRTIYQINNGAAGAPYYAQQQTPWTAFTDGFTTQNALVLFHIEGKMVELEVLNPDTLEEIDRLVIKE
jgi:hypothetical protein